MKNITLKFIPNLRLRNAVGKFLNKLYEYKTLWDIRRSEKEYERGEYYSLETEEDWDRLFG